MAAQHSQTGAATELTTGSDGAATSSTGNATGHAPGLDAVAADRADHSIDNLVVTLFQFLTYILQDPFSTPGFDNAREHASVNESDCIDIVYESIATSDEQGGLYYNEPQLLLHKKLWDVVTREKMANANNTTLPTGADELLAMLKRAALLQSMLQMKRKSPCTTDHWLTICLQLSLLTNKKEIPSTS